MKTLTNITSVIVQEPWFFFRLALGISFFALAWIIGNSGIHIPFAG